MLKAIYQGLNELMITWPAQRGNTYRLFFMDSKEGLRQFSKVDKETGTASVDSAGAIQPRLSQMRVDQLGHFKH